MKSSDRACRTIRAATSESQVIQAVSEYLKSLHPTVVAIFPAELMAVGLQQAEEVIHSALDIVHRQIARSDLPAEADTLNEIVLVLSTAARRLAILAGNTA